ncbi:unnamed protein product [Sphenostylis stenocarpa]|uniref:Uncharacterized protein n=1 Tax=Sphenostylis stenocarpa TaxID=92480 RepID=A0AA86VLN2_9FABA|nr:unnamed protein product [Sphenostylis stenocarpa]
MKEEGQTHKEMEKGEAKHRSDEEEGFVKTLSGTPIDTVFSTVLLPFYSPDGSHQMASNSQDQHGVPVTILSTTIWLPNSHERKDSM